MQVLAAALGDSRRYDLLDYTVPTAIIVGTESSGLTSMWLREADARIAIPMQGAIDSMNVSVAASVLIFEAKRQRGFSG